MAQGLSGLRSQKVFIIRRFYQKIYKRTSSKWAEIYHVAVWKTLFADAGVANQTIEEADFITFSSGSTVEGFYSVLSQFDLGVTLCAIGDHGS